MGCLQAVAQLLKEPESLNGSGVVAAEQAMKGIIQVLQSLHLLTAQHTKRMPTGMVPALTLFLLLCAMSRIASRRWVSLRCWEQAAGSSWHSCGISSPSLRASSFIWTL